jgi:molybdenum cofactor guanylyltransferase
MGRDKAALPFGDETLLRRVVRIVSAAVDDVVVVARAGQELPALPADVRVVFDDVEGRGPLGGLGPGLRASRADAVFATGCDAPFLQRAVIDLLFARLATSDAAVAETDGHPHPLCAVYRASIAPTVDRLVAENRLRAADLAGVVRSVRVTESELRAVDPDLASFVNCNTQEAYEAALRRATGLRDFPM